MAVLQALFSTFRMFNTSIAKGDVNVTIEGTYGKDAVMVVKPTNGSRYVSGKKEIRIEYKRVPITDFIDNTVSILDSLTYNSTRDLVVAINEAYGISLEPEDIEDIDIPNSTNRPDGYYSIPITCTKDSRLFYGTTNLIIGDLGYNDDNQYDHTVDSVYILNDGVLNTTTGSILRLAGTDLSVDTSWVLGKNITNIQLWEPNQIATTQNHIIIDGSFNISYIDFTSGVPIDTGVCNRITISKIGLIEYHANLTNAGLIYASSKFNYYFDLYSAGGGTTISRYTVAHVLENSTTKTFSTSVGAVSSDGGLVYLSKPATIDNISTVKCYKSTATLETDISFNPISISLYDVNTGSFTNMVDISSISTTDNFVDIYIETGMSPATNNLIPYVNGESYLPSNTPPVTEEVVGWLPVVRATYDGDVSIIATKYNPMFYYFAPEFYWDSGSIASPDVIMTTNDDYIIIQAVRPNHVSSEDSIVVLAFKYSGEVVPDMFTQDIRQLCSLAIEEGSNIKILPDNRLIIAGKVIPTLRNTYIEPKNTIVVYDITNNKKRVFERPDNELYADIEHG